MTPEERLRSILPDGRFPGAAPERSIKQAEAALGLLFPPSYRHFLAVYGAFAGPGFQVAGLIHPAPSEDQTPFWHDVERETLRHSAEEKPPDSVYISMDGLSETYWLQCSTSDTKVEGQVLAWGPYVPDGCAVFANSFLSFLAKCAEGA